VLVPGCRIQRSHYLCIICPTNACICKSRLNLLQAGEVAVEVEVEVEGAGAGAGAVEGEVAGARVGAFAVGHDG
jgi:hypothetical protein